MRQSLARALWTQLGAIRYAGIVIVAVILFWEHRILKPDDLSRVNVAFFSLNGYVSILLLLTFAAYPDAVNEVSLSLSPAA